MEMSSLGFEPMTFRDEVLHLNHFAASRLAQLRNNETVAAIPIEQN